MLSLARPRPPPNWPLPLHPDAPPHPLSTQKPRKQRRTHLHFSLTLLIHFTFSRAGSRKKNKTKKTWRMNIFTRAGSVRGMSPTQPPMAVFKRSDRAVPRSRALKADVRSKENNDRRGEDRRQELGGFGNVVALPPIRTQTHRNFRQIQGF